MKSYLLKRTLSLIPIFFGILLILGIMFAALPGDCLSASIGMDPKVKHQLREQLHLNDPKIVQFGYWLKSTINGEFGHDAWGNDYKPMLKRAIKNSLISYSAAFLLSFIISIPLGMIAACHVNGIFDRIIRVFISIFSCIPEFMAALLIGLFVNYGAKISQVYSDTAYLTPIPKTKFTMYLAMVTTLVLVTCSGSLRYVRTSIIDIINKDYIRTARSKGLKEKIVLYRHGLRNALIPIITHMGNTLIVMISSSITMEIVLGYWGIGYAMYIVILRRQYWLMLSLTFFVVIFTLLINYFIDILYAIIDPRVRYNR
ncbi:oligopeptide transport system permease protein OppB [Clostridium tepidiprofundi DSM 19306]|uniref:Oligopeptide transport system permease protein OppB n=1 Tax=Clostridium tepidiprofundi DSM 19306 TaxID=1121338 RepID=A0A151B6H7_9CLOT|nr:ABC transporter permease [Clostridium tepidiprofundi]KYH35535.1 oligopeptide transport system permease protein OppB [Clostridium tepidiprofundi DSM 19306]